MTAHKEDVRITKTKAALTKAFFDMLQEKSIQDLTINELCEKANVRRATFYKHFSDKNDFILFLIKDVRAKFDTEIWKADLNSNVTKEYYVQYAEALIAYLIEREVAIKKIINSPVRSTFFDVFLHENYEDTKRRLEVSAESGITLISSPDVVASMIVGGIAYCIIKWLDADDSAPAEKLLADISAFLDRLLD